MSHTHIIKGRGVSGYKYNSIRYNFIWSLRPGRYKEYDTILSGPSGRAGTKSKIQFCLVLQAGPVRYHFVWSLRPGRYKGYANILYCPKDWAVQIKPSLEVELNVICWVFFLVFFFCFYKPQGIKRVSIIYIYFTCLFVCNGQNG